MQSNAIYNEAATKVQTISEPPPPSLLHTPTKAHHYTIPLSHLVGRSPKRRAGISVNSRVSIDVENNTGLIPLIKARARNSTSGRNGSASTNLEVEALGIQLRTIVVLAAVQGDDLVADDVVAGSKFGGKNGGGDEVVLDERVGDPGSGGDDGGLADFGPAEGGGGEGRAVTCATY